MTVPVIDGHNDAFTRLEQAGASDAAFLSGTGTAVNLATATQGGLVAGLFAVTVPAGELDVRHRDGGYEVMPMPAVDRQKAAMMVEATAARVLRTIDASDGRLRLVTEAAGLDVRLDGTGLGVVLHMEGAEALRPYGGDLDRWYDLGLRSLGPVWSRPNAFGEGVPFRFPCSPGTGPGLTRAGIALVRGCRALGIAVDVSHLNAAGFRDVARIGGGPIIASHSSVHALCPSTRNLTDDQLDEIAASEGLVGINFEVSSVRADGRDDPDTPLARIAEHVRYVADRVGVDHVAFGSDFDGARMPTGLQRPDQLQALLATLRDHGFDREELKLIAHRNWRRALTASWS